MKKIVFVIKIICSTLLFFSCVQFQPVYAEETPSASPDAATEVSPYVDQTTEPDNTPAVTPEVEETITPSIDVTESPIVEETETPVIDETIDPSIDTTLEPSVSPTVSPISESLTEYFTLTKNIDDSYEIGTIINPSFTFSFKEKTDIKVYVDNNAIEYTNTNGEYSFNLELNEEKPYAIKIIATYKDKEYVLYEKNVSVDVEQYEIIGDNSHPTSYVEIADNEEIIPVEYYSDDYGISLFSVGGSFIVTSSDYANTVTLYFDGNKLIAEGYLSSFGGNGWYINSFAINSKAGLANAYKVDVSSNQAVPVNASINLPTADGSYTGYIYYTKNDAPSSYYQYIPFDYTITNGYADFKTYATEDNNKSFIDTLNRSIPSDNAAPLQGLKYAVVNDFAKQLCNDANSDIEKIRRIHDWIADNIYYDYEYLNNNASKDPYWVTDPYGVFMRRTAICSGYASLANAMLHAVGIPCVNVYGYASNNELTTSDFANADNHEWNAVYADGAWYAMDVTWDSKNAYSNITGSYEFNYGGFDRRYFLCDNKIISKEHNATKMTATLSNLYHVNFYKTYFVGNTNYSYPLSQQMVWDGDGATAPVITENDAPSNLLFTGWSTDFSEVHDSINVFTVYVEKTYIESITNCVSSLKGYVGDVRDFPIIVAPDEYNFDKVVYSSSDPKIATVDKDGMITFIAPGNCIIYASSEHDGSIKASMNINVKTGNAKGFQDFIITQDKNGDIHISSSDKTWINNVNSITLHNNDKEYQIISPNDFYIKNNEVIIPLETMVNTGYELEMLNMVVESTGYTTDYKGVDFELARNAIVPVTNITLGSNVPSTMHAGEKYGPLTLEYFPTVATNSDELVFASSNPNVATIDQNGLVTAIAAGSVTLSATIGSMTRTRQYVVTAKMTSLTPSTSIVNVMVGNKFKVTVTKNPSTSSDKYTWTSSNTSIATIDQDGYVTGVKVGTTTVVCTSNEDPTVKTTVKVVVSVAPTGITLSQNNATMTVGQTLQLKAAPIPSSCTQEVAYYTSDASIVTVNSVGKVTAVDNGDAKIYAKVNGTSYMAICDITVGSDLTSLVINQGTLISLEDSQTKQLTLTFSPSTITNKNVVYTSSNNSIATVSSTGLVKGIKTGKATITVTSASDASVKDTIDVVVSSPCSKLNFAVTTAATLTEKYVVNNVKNISFYANLRDGSTPTINIDNSDANVAEVTLNAASKFFTVKAVNPGKSTVTITCGSKKIIYYIIVYPVVYNAKLNSTLVNYNNTGMEVRDTVKMNVFTNLDSTIINNKMTYTSSNPAVATVSSDGTITAIKAGTVKITAKLTDDPSGRYVYQSIKVINKQVTRIDMEVVSVNNTHIDNNIVSVDESDSDNNIIYVEYNKIATPYAIRINELLYDKEDYLVTNTNVKWVSNDSSVAKIATNSKTKVTTLTILKAGQVTLTCTAQDITKTQKTVTLIVRDYQPRLQSNVFTFNANSTNSVPLNIYPSYGNNIQSISINSVTTSTKLFNVNNETLSFIGDSNIPNGSYKVVIRALTDKGTFDYNATIKVVRTVPSSSLKISGNYNTYTNINTLSTVFNHKNEVPESYTLDANLALYWTMNANGSISRTSTPFPNNKPVVSGKLYIRYKGYLVDKVLSIKIPVVSTKPTYALSKTSSIMYKDGSSSVTFQLINSKTKEIIDLTNLDITLGTKSINGATVSVNANTITVNNPNKLSGYAVIQIKDHSWSSTLTLNHKISVVTSYAKAKAATTTLLINTNSLNSSASTKVTLNQSNVECYNGLIPMYPKKPSTETNKLNVRYENGEIFAEVINSSIVAGTYPYTLVMKDSNNNTLNTLTINVKVLTVSPTVSNKLTGTINPIDRENGYVTDTVTFKNINDTIATATLSNNMFEAEVDETGKKVYIRAKAGVSLVNGQYYSMTLTIKGNECSTPIISTIKIRVVQSLPKLKVTNPTLTMYSSVNKADDVVGASLISITNKPGAQIESVTPMYNATLQKAFKYTFSQTSTGGIIQVMIKDPSKIKASSTSALKFKITYVDMATNTTAYSYVTIKVVDRTYKINAIK